MAAEHNPLRGKSARAVYAGVLGCLATVFGSSVHSAERCLGPTFVDDLDKTGFFDTFDAATAGELHSAMSRDGAAAMFKIESLGLIHADTEDIAEGGAAQFLTQLLQVLKRYGVTVESITGTYSDIAHTVQVDGKDHVVFDFENEAIGEVVDRFWSISAARTFAIANTWLQTANAPVRVYAIGSGNGGWAFVTTPAAAALLSKCRDLGYERPYIPSETPPYYGIEAGWLQ